MIPLRNTDKENLSAEERAEIDEAWGRESERRMAELEAGKTEPIPSKEVHKCIQTRLKAMREAS